MFASDQMRYSACTSILFLKAATTKKLSLSFDNVYKSIYITIIAPFFDRLL